MNVPDGWIDLQVNGFLGINFTGSDLTEDAVHAVTRELVDRGVGAYCPTLITAPDETYRRNLPIVAKAMAHPELGRHILGIHLEGPSFNRQCSGAHPGEYLRDPDIAAFKQWNEWANGTIVLHTLAPELPGALPFIEQLNELGVVPSMGHHFADPETTHRAVQAGARVSTHLGNGIPAMVDRHQNPIIDQLAEDDLSVMFIPDGHHLPINVIKLIHGMKDIGQCIAVSDCAPIAGLEPGSYNLWGKDVILKPDGSIRQAEDPRLLAGSGFDMSQCMAFLEGTGIFTPEECYAIGRINPLRLLGIDS